MSSSDGEEEITAEALFVSISISISKSKSKSNEFSSALSAARLSVSVSAGAGAGAVPARDRRGRDARTTRNGSASEQHNNFVMTTVTTYNLDMPGWTSLRAVCCVLELSKQAKLLALTAMILAPDG
jgi:hypothetical protein